MCSGFPAYYTDRPLISLAVQFQFFSVLFTLSIYFNGLGGCRTRPQTLQIVQFGHQVLHQVVFGEAPLVEHLREQRKQLREAQKSASNQTQSQYCSVYSVYLFILHYSMSLLGKTQN